ncbi:MAG: T9SS type A sorting domain-containing protein [Bacteroidales bacterium]
MKKFTIIMAVLFTLTFNAKAQIPNNGFENWIIQSGIEIPQPPWVTNNLQPKPNGATYNPVTKSTDHYPLNVGSYSIRLENNTSFTSEVGEPLPYWACSYGYSTTAFFPGYGGPTFPIAGHPNSLCGYYKCTPLNNDTMTISAALFLNGAIVSKALFTTTATANNWTSFSIPFTAYTTADSAQIGMSAFYAKPDAYPAGPYGNSVLFVDNLSFDALITSITETASKRAAFNLYPNPANEIVSLNVDYSRNTDLTLSIYNSIGKLVSSEILHQNQQQINISNLSNGIYTVKIKSKEWAESQKLIIQR